MATYKFVLFSGSRRKDGSYPVSMRITKNRRSKFIRSGLVATPEQWNTAEARFVADRRLVPHYREWNARLSELEVQVNAIFRRFETERVDWTLNQFEEAFLDRAPQSCDVQTFFADHIRTLCETGHIGNSLCYSRTLRMLQLFDSIFHKRVFSEIDLRYVRSFDNFLQMRGCCGNTRKYYCKTLCAILNRAIQEQKGSSSTYPFGKSGFRLSQLDEETTRRYLTQQSMHKLKTCVVEPISLEIARRLFLFLYYCYGISFIDAALLTRQNLLDTNEGLYIVYKRRKTREAKRVKSIRIKVTQEIAGALTWFRAQTSLTEDYLLPVVSQPGLSGEELYHHIRCRFFLNNKHLHRLAALLHITELPLTSYVSRHTMAMTLQDHHVPREVISQILGHSKLSTTQTYLDSFGSDVIDDAVRFL